MKACSIGRIILGLLVIAVLGFLIFQSSPETQIVEFTIRGSSMAPVLNPNESIQADYAPDWSPKKGDIVILNCCGQNEELVKKIYGVPGDTIAVESGPSTYSHLLIDGAVIKNSSAQPFLFNQKKTAMLKLYAGPIPDEAYLILGENQYGSYDSSAFGLVSRKEIVARVIFPR